MDSPREPSFSLDQRAEDGALVLRPMGGRIVTGPSAGEQLDRVATLLREADIEIVATSKTRNFLATGTTVFSFSNGDATDVIQMMANFTEAMKSDRDFVLVSLGMSSEMERKLRSTGIETLAQAYGRRVDSYIGNDNVEFILKRMRAPAAISVRRKIVVTVSRIVAIFVYLAAFIVIIHGFIAHTEATDPWWPLSWFYIVVAQVYAWASRFIHDRRTVKSRRQQGAH